MPSKLQKAIGAVKDQTSISLAKVVSSNKTNLEVAILKATTHDDLPMDERHVMDILRLVSSNKANAACCARAIGKRVGRTRNWVVAIKSLMLVLRIFQDGDPYFPREVLHAMRRGARILNLSNFRDDSNSSPWDFTAFIRTFALYLDERLDCFLTGKLQRRFTHRDPVPAQGDPNSYVRKGWRGNNEPVRDMKPPMLLDKISHWQRLLERAVATRPTGSARSNRLVQISLYAVVQETFDLYRDISDGLGLLLDRFFHLQYNSCVSAFQACLKATKQFEELSAFYDLCKSIGVGRTSEYPSVQTISEELIGTLQEFLKDQTSFPSRCPARTPLLLPAPSSVGDDGAVSPAASSRGRGSFKIPELGKRSISLEDLISATELNEPTPSISIDLEAYSIADQFGKNLSPKGSQNDETGSTRSLPVTNSLGDLVMLDEWPHIDQEQEDFNIDERSKGQQHRFSATGWEIVISDMTSPPRWSQQNLNNFDPFSSQELEATTSSSSQQNASIFDPFSNQEHDPKRKLESDSGKGWELILAQSADNLNPQNSFKIDSLQNEQSYNPFLQDSGETLALPPPEMAVTGTELGFPIGDGFFTGAPTFQATPTFSAQNQSSGTSFSNEIDPFATFSVGDEAFSSSGNQRNLLQEQELWLQQQNKIIARHMT